MIITGRHGYHVGQDSVVGTGIVMGWTVRGSNLGGATFSVPFQTGHRAHPASCKICTGFLIRREMRPGRAVDHALLFGAEVKEGIEPHFYSLSGTSWPVLG